MGKGQEGQEVNRKKRNLNDGFELYTLPLIRTKLKRLKKGHFSPILHGLLSGRKGKAKWKAVRVLLDSGASATIVDKELIATSNLRKSAKSEWETKAGTFSTSYVANVQMTLPELDPLKNVHWQVHVNDAASTGRYDVILGQDLLCELGLVLDFGKAEIRCDEVSYQG